MPVPSFLAHTSAGDSSETFIATQIRPITLSPVSISHLVFGLVSPYRTRLGPSLSVKTTSQNRKRKASEAPDIIQPGEQPGADINRPAKKANLASAPLSKPTLPATPLTQASTMESDDDFNSPVSSEEDFNMDDDQSDLSLNEGMWFAMSVRFRPTDAPRAQSPTSKTSNPILILICPIRI